MRLGRKREEQASAPTVDEAAAAVEAIETQLGADRAELQELQVAIATAEHEQDSLVELEVNGELDSEEAQRRFEDLGNAISRARTEVDRVSRLIREREWHLSQRREGLARARFDQAREAWSEACEAAGDTATAFAAKLAELEVAAAALVEARGVVDESGARAKALAPVDVDVVDPGSLDEPSWEASPELLQLLEAGPRQPRADGERSLAKLALDSENRDQTLKGWFSRNPSLDAIDQLPEHLQQWAREERARQAELGRQRREEREAGRSTPSITG